MIAEDPGIAVLVGADRVPDAEVGEHPGEDLQRMLDPRVLGIRLDLLERRLGEGPLNLEFGHEDDRVRFTLSANTTGRSFERKQKLVKYWM